MNEFIVISISDVDGGWSDWSQLESQCTKECDVGSATRVRSCTNPTPQGNGKLCNKEDGDKTDGVEFKLVPCNVHSCWSEYCGEAAVTSQGRNA